MLTRDVTTPFGCFLIDASDVSLDLGGHTITGHDRTFATGIDILPWATNARVANGTLTGFSAGVLAQASGAHIEDVTVGDSFVGINVSPTNHLLSGIVLSGDRAVGDDLGIAQLGVVGGRVAGNTASGNTSWGILVLPKTTGTQFVGNTATGNGFQGIAVEVRATSNLLVGNTATGNPKGGIVMVRGATHNRIASNTATGDVAPRFADLEDFNPGCDSNQWVANIFSTSLSIPAGCIH